MKTITTTKTKDMTTVREWLNELPNPYRTQALTNMENDVPHMSDYEAGSFSEAIIRAFNWDETIEGFHYWNDLYESFLRDAVGK